MRIREDGIVRLAPVGRLSGVRIEPIEAQSLLHFLPGTLVLSVGKGGTNLRSRLQANGPSRDAPIADRLPDLREPEEIGRWARELGCASVALGDTEPTVMHEYAIKVARACRAAGLRTVALTRGYVCPEPRAELYRHIDAARVELLGFDDGFYRQHCDGHIAPVKDTLAYIARQGSVWLEIAVPLIPGENDAVGDIERFCRWLVDHLGADVPLHFKASHLISTRQPDQSIRAVFASARVQRIARAAGVRHVYSDDLLDASTRATICQGCGERLIGREWYLVTEWGLTAGNRCSRCGERLAGVFRGCPSGGADWPAAPATYPN